MQISQRIAYWAAWLRWFFARPLKHGHPMYGEGEQREKNIRMILRRHYEQEPKRENYLRSA